MLPVIRRRNNSDALAESRDLFGDFDRFLDSFWRGPSQMTSMVGGLDIYEDKDSIHVDCDLPGFKKEDISLTLEEDILRISAERKSDREENNEGSYYVRERGCQSFSRSIRMPQNIMQDKVSAEYDNGVLRIAVEKRPESKPQTISIK